MKRKIKKYADGGLAGIADTATSLMGDVNSITDKINYGTGTGFGAAGPVGFSAVSGMKKGGAVKSAASKRADGIAQRGKTRGKMR